MCFPSSLLFYIYIYIYIYILYIYKWKNTKIHVSEVDEKKEMKFELLMLKLLCRVVPQDHYERMNCFRFFLVSKAHVITTGLLCPRIVSQSSYNLKRTHTGRVSTNMHIMQQVAGLSGYMWNAQYQDTNICRAFVRRNNICQCVKQRR